MTFHWPTKDVCGRQKNVGVGPVVRQVKLGFRILCLWIWIIIQTTTVIVHAHYKKMFHYIVLTLLHEFYLHFKIVFMKDIQNVIIHYRSFLGAGVPAVSSSSNRIVEALCITLCALHASPRKKGGVMAFNVFVNSYMAISQAILGNAILTERTSLVLPPISVHTLCSWLV